MTAFKQGSFRAAFPRALIATFGACAPAQSTLPTQAPQCKAAALPLCSKEPAPPAIAVGGLRSVPMDAQATVVGRLIVGPGGQGWAYLALVEEDARRLGDGPLALISPNQYQTGFWGSQPPTGFWPAGKCQTEAGGFCCHWDVAGQKVRTRARRVKPPLVLAGPPKTDGFPLPNLPPWIEQPHWLDKTQPLFAVAPLSLCQRPD